MTRMIVGLIGSSEFISSRTIPTIDSKMMNKSNWFHLLAMKITVTLIAFHILPCLPKSPEISVRSQSFGKVFFWLEYSRSPLQGVHLFQSENSSQIRHSIFGKLVHYSNPTSLQLFRELGKWMRNWKSHSSWLVQFDWKVLFHFPLVFPPVTDWSVCIVEARP